jgi:hypothetical protein
VVHREFVVAQGARNLKIILVVGEAVVALDDDCLPPDSAIEECGGRLEGCVAECVAGMEGVSAVGACDDRIAVHSHQG